jgi:hypothetical protein
MRQADRSQKEIGGLEEPAALGFHRRGSNAVHEKSRVTYRKALASCKIVAMVHSVSKPKLPKGVSYVLKTSQLDKVLTDAGIDCHVDLVYWQPRDGESILEAHYWLANENVPYPRVYVRAGVVPSPLRRAASDVLRSLGLPRFTNWLREVIACRPDRRRCTKNPISTLHTMKKDWP